MEWWNNALRSEALPTAGECWKNATMEYWNNGMMQTLAGAPFSWRRKFTIRWNKSYSKNFWSKDAMLCVSEIMRYWEQWNDGKMEQWNIGTMEWCRHWWGRPSGGGKNLPFNGINPIRKIFECKDAMLCISEMMRYREQWNDGKMEKWNIGTMEWCRHWRGRPSVGEENLSFNGINPIRKIFEVKTQCFASLRWCDIGNNGTMEKWKNGILEQWNDADIGGGDLPLAGKIYHSME